MGMEKRKALLIGNDNYKDVSKLDGCINDIKGVKELLEKQEGYYKNLYEMQFSTEIV